jgi:ABC-type nitrate/sulfonate/bicarbonate transport system substrate-binding protein
MFKRGVIALLAILFPIAFAPAQEFKSVRMGYPSLGFRQGHIWVAKDEGLFARYGLDVEPVFLRGGQLAIQALAAGDPPLMSIGQVVQANLSGFNLVLISGYGAATHFAALILLKHLNLEAGKDVILVPGGPDAERVAALAAGKIDASVFNSSTVPVAKKMGFTELVYIPDLGVEVQGNGFATTRAYLKSNRDIVKAALKGYIEGIHFTFHNKQAAQKVYAKYMRTNDPEVLEQSYQVYVKTTPKKPYPTLKGLQFLLDQLAPQMPQAKSAKPEQFVDLSLLQELEKEGFFTEMTKRYPPK